MKNWLRTRPATSVVKSDLTLTPSLHRKAEAHELQALLAREQEIIQERKRAADSRETGVVGLGLSGGGIRSATFCFGVLQVLERKGVMRHVDFLSTVSGGGYTGAAYSAWRLRQTLANRAESPADGYDTVAVKKQPPQTWDQLLPHLRKFSNYLSPSLGIGSPGTWRIVATMVRNLTIHWLALVAAIVVAFAFMLLSLRFLWSVSVFCAIGGLLLIAIGLKQERAGRLYVRDCQSGTSSKFGGKFARLRQWITQRLTSPDASRCDVLATKVQGLLQAPHLKIFTGLLLYGLGVALGFVFTTYPEFPRITNALPDVLPLGIFLHKIVPDNVAADFTLYTGTRFYAAIFLVAFSIVLVSTIGFASEWRWRPRRNFWPRFSWIGFVLMLTLFLVVWFSLAYHNNGLMPVSGAELIDLIDIFPRAVTWSIHGAWAYAWQTGLVLLSFAFLISITIAVFNQQMDREEREWSTRVISVCLVAAIAWTGLAALVLGSAKLAQIAFIGSVSGESQLGGLSLTGLWLVISTFIARLGRTEGLSSLARTHWKRVAIVVGPWFFIAGLIVVTCFGAAFLLLTLSAKFPPNDVLSPNVASIAILWSGWHVFALLSVAAVVFLTAGIILDPNEYSLHGFYRDRLVRSYLGASNADTPAPDSIWNIRTDDVPLSDTLTAVTAERGGAPFHIVNTAVNLFGSKDLQVQQRCCDSFVLTPLSCGSWATNYTEIPPRLYLGTALAISGAAVSSNAGLATQGAAIAALMTFFNMRLGYWFGNPRFPDAQARKRPLFSPSYLFTEAFSATNEDRPFVNLSDGGHFDNLGLYELIRRRCRYIVIVDSECDPTYDFSSLAEVIRMVRIDFDVNIQIDVQTIAPKLGERFTCGHWVLGKIFYKDQAADPRRRYPDRGLRDEGEIEGRLLYIKSSFVGGDNSYISADLVEYAKRHPSFPHDTTADQFFNEQQFESYRKLGECIAGKMLDGMEPPQDVASLFAFLEAKPKAQKQS